MIDFKGYYDNILHSKVYERLDKKVPDAGVRRLAGQLVEPFDNGEGKSLGIGSQISQIIAIDYASEIDHLIKHTLHIKYHSHYMDDFALIHESKDYLFYCLDEIEKVCAEYGITINRRKTQVVKLSHGFTFLKIRWTLTDTGKVIKRPNKDSITRERRKLKKLKDKLDKGEVTMDLMTSKRPVRKVATTTAHSIQKQRPETCMLSTTAQTAGQPQKQPKTLSVKY